MNRPKIFLFIFVLILSISLVGCSDSTDSDIEIDEDNVPMENEDESSSIEIYTATFILNGGDLSNLSPLSFTQEMLPYVLPIPIREGYYFLGWYEDKNLNGNSVIDIPASTVLDMTYYAKWELVNYNINFLLNDGFLDEDFPTYYNVTQLPLELPIPSKRGFDFLAWYEEMHFNGEQVHSLPANAASEVTLYAKWELITFSIDFLSVDGIMDDTAYFNISQLPYVLPIPSRDGYRFLGWFDLDNLFGQPTTQIGLDTAENKAFNARWSRLHSIIYFLDGGVNNHLNPAEYTSEDNVTIYPPSKEGFIFDGWYVDQDFTKPAIVNFEQHHNDKVYYAKWIKPYSINYYSLDNALGGRIFARSENSAFLTNDGKIYTWGNNSKGQIIGDGTWGNTPVVSPLDITSYFPPLDSDDKFIDISIGQESYAALTSKGRVFAWGIQGESLNGINFLREITSKFNLDSDDKIIDLKLGDFHASAISAKGHLFTLGPNYGGQLGNNGTVFDFNKNPSPITFIFDLPTEETLVTISVGGNHSSVISSMGRVFVWGSNHQGQLGDGTYETKFFPIEITENFDLRTNEEIVSLHLGGQSSLAISSMERIFTWGELAQSSMPTDITSSFNFFSGERIKFVESSFYNFSVITSNDRVFIWGFNNSGQIGDGTNNRAQVPVDITPNFNLNSGEKILSVGLGVSHSLAISSDSKIFAWGNNSSGQLGDGTRINK